MKLKSNIGTADRTVRLLLAIMLIVLFYTEVLCSGFGIAGLVLALLLTLTSLISFCPLYKIFNISSVFHKNEDREKPKTKS